MSELEQLNGNIREEWKSLLSSFSNQDGSEIKYNISSEIPELESIIETHPRKEKLEEEIKNLAMKFYWDGFYKGKSCLD